MDGSNFPPLRVAVWDEEPVQREEDWGLSPGQVVGVVLAIVAAAQLYAAFLG